MGERRKKEGFRTPMPIKLKYFFSGLSRLLAFLLSSSRFFRDKKMSPVAIALWYVPKSNCLVKCSMSFRSLALKPSKEPFTFIPQSDLRITNIALGDELSDPSGRTSVKLTYQTPIKLDDDDEED